MQPRTWRSIHTTSINDDYWPTQRIPCKSSPIESKQGAIRLARSINIHGINAYLRRSSPPHQHCDENVARTPLHVNKTMRQAITNCTIFAVEMGQISPGQGEKLELASFGPLRRTTPLRFQFPSLASKIWSIGLIESMGYDSPICLVG